MHTAGYSIGLSIDTAVFDSNHQRAENVFNVGELSPPIAERSVSVCFE